MQLPYTSSPHAKSSRTPSANASAQMVMASCPLVWNTRSAGRPITWDFTGSAMCSAGIHCRAPISACPVLSRTYDKCTVLMPFSTLPAHPMYCLLTPAVDWPFFSCPDSSSAPIRRPRRRPDRRAASSRPATANRRTTPITANVSQQARFSSRCVRSGVRSPACWAMLQPFRFARPLITAPAYFRACSHGSTRANDGFIRPSSSARFRWPSPAHKLTAAAAFGFVVFTHA